jgi:hypothetical protein
VHLHRRSEAQKQSARQVMAECLGLLFVDRGPPRPKERAMTGSPFWRPRGL